MGKATEIIKHVRIIILLSALILAVIAIHPMIDADGVAIRSINKGSAAADAGIELQQSTAPTARERIIAIDGQPISSIAQYGSVVAALLPNQTISLTTNQRTYIIEALPITETIILNESEFLEQNITDPETNISSIVLIEVNKTQVNVLGTQDIGLGVFEPATSNIRKGLDLQGGTRVVLAPEEEIDQEDLEFIIENMEQRLNVFGLTDITVRAASDLPVYLGGTGKEFIIVEIAGANEEEVKDLLSKQGKFEAKIGNATIFRGGNDILYVCRSADCSGIDPFAACGEGGEGAVCRFRFSISLSPEAAQRQADATKDVGVIADSTAGQGTGGYLVQPLDLFLDDELVDSLNIGADLRGRAVTDIEISGSGTGVSQQAAITDTLQEMKRLQTILITGSLPVKLAIVKTDSISPALGKSFVENAFRLAFAVFAAVSLMIFIRYRQFKVAIPIVIMLFAEVVLLLGLASVIGWNIDLAAIAGIIIVLGTSVDHQIVITDETLRGERLERGLRSNIKSAFFIIMAAYSTTVVAMLPLLFAGAGLLKGFALTSIFGISIGVFITRPAYAAIIEILLRKNL